MYVHRWKSNIRVETEDINLFKKSERDQYAVREQVQSNYYYFIVSTTNLLPYGNVCKVSERTSVRVSLLNFKE